VGILDIEVVETLAGVDLQEELQAEQAEQ